ncbi:MAG TPA: S41 family peptidase [Bacteroidota bacterium]|nr:S41 family peptidase [Bacteroidota bacterium]
MRHNVLRTIRQLSSFTSIAVIFSLRVWAQQTAGQEVYRNLTLFSDVFNQVRTNYIENVPPTYLIESAIEGLLSSLDPHSSYLDSSRLRLFKGLSEGVVTDVGVELEVINGYPFIVSMIDESPAAKSTLIPGDILTKVDDTVTYGLPEVKLRLLLMGSKGSPVRLTIRKPVTNEEKVVTLLRDEISLKTVPISVMLDQTTGYVRISRFGFTTAEEYRSAVGKLRDEGMKNLLLDLRSNPGGTMKSAQEILDMYAPKGDLISRVAARKDVANETTYASDQHKEPNYSISVLINGSSASAAELVAGTLQDLDRALIIGNRSFGKGLVQSLFFLSNRGALLMTTGKYYTASGRCLQRTYKGKRPLEYYMETFGPDSIPTEDSLRMSTKGGRTIFAGGGVFPDVPVRSLQLDLLRKIDHSGSAVQWASTNLSRCVQGFKTFEKFQKAFAVTDEMMNNFIAGCESNQLDTTELRQNSGILTVLLKSEVAALQWGRSAWILISKDIDPIIQEAIRTIPKAQELMEKSKK